MGQHTVILKQLIPLEILVFGVFLLIILYYAQTLLIKLFPLLTGRMNIVFGYCTLTSVIVSFISFYHILFSAAPSTLFFTLLSVDPFSTTIYSCFYLLIIIITFFTIREKQDNSDDSYSQFISILLVLIGLFFIILTTNWILLYLGFLLLFVGGMSVFSFSEQKNRSSLEFTTFYNLLILVFLFFSICCFYFETQTIFIVFSLQSGGIVGLIGLLIFFTSILMVAGIPPFHLWFNLNLKNNFTSTKTLFLVVYRSLALFILIKYYPLFAVYLDSVYLSSLFLAYGTILLFWGALASLTENRLIMLANNFSLMFTGNMFFFLSLAFVNFTSINTELHLLYAIVYLLIGKMFLLTLLLCVMVLTEFKYDTDEINALKGVARHNISLASVLVLTLVMLVSLSITANFYGKILFFQITYSFTTIFITISIILSFLLFFFVILKLLVQSLWIKQKKVKVRKYRITEPTIHYALSFALVPLIILIILNQEFLNFCWTMVQHLL